MSQSLERLFSPSILDKIFPFFAFFFVIILPMCFGLYVVYKVLSGQYPDEDQKNP
jgi:hypothetical protein